MLTAENIQKMKRINVSANGELTKERTRDILKTATRRQKNEIDELAGVKRVSINRVYAKGGISAKIAVAIAQVMNVNPSYLTGESDERGEFTDVNLDVFLIAHGYKELVSLNKPEKPSRKKVQPVVFEEENGVDDGDEVDDNTEKAAPEAQPVIVKEPQVVEIQPVIEIKPEVLNTKAVELTTDEAVQLLRALYLRARFNPEAVSLLAKIQSLLV